MKNYLLLLALALLAGRPARAQWALQPFAFTSTLAPLPPFGVQAINIVDAQTVWTAGVAQYMGANYGANEVAHTANGGTTWTVNTVPGMDFLWEIISNTAGLNASTALICTVNAMGPGRIMKTTDGGVTWTTQTTAAQYGSTDSYADFVLAFSPTEMLCVGDPIASLGNRFELYRSTDAGMTWTAAATTMPVALSGEYATPYHKARVGNHVWFTTNMGRVFHSADKGVSWTVSQTSLTDVGSIAFRDALNGLSAMPGGGGLVRTTNGGATWAAVALTGPAHASLAAVPGTNNYLSAGQGPDAGSSFSRDNGTTWTAIETTRSHFDVAAFSPTVAWSAAVSYTSTAVSGLGAYKLTSPVLGTAAPAAAAALEVFPNPSADGRFSLALPAGAATQSLTVLDALGRTALSQPLAPAGRAELSLAAQAPGLYTLLVRTSQGLVRRQLVRQ